MTTKLKFIEAACVVFNCTHSVVLNAVAGRATMHPKLAKSIAKFADKSCNATKGEWRAFAKACDTKIAQDILFGLVSGAEIQQK